MVVNEHESISLIHLPIYVGSVPTGATRGILPHTSRKAPSMYSDKPMWILYKHTNQFGAHSTMN